MTAGGRICPRVELSEIVITASQEFYDGYKKGKRNYERPYDF
jgi:hypothetical protein